MLMSVFLSEHDERLYQLSVCISYQFMFQYFSFLDVLHV
jgi:hypothetical protein